MYCTFVLHTNGTYVFNHSKYLPDKLDNWNIAFITSIYTCAISSYSMALSHLLKESYIISVQYSCTHVVICDSRYFAAMHAPSGNKYLNCPCSHYILLKTILRGLKCMQCKLLNCKINYLLTSTGFIWGHSMSYEVMAQIGYSVIWVILLCMYPEVWGNIYINKRIK